MKTKLLLGFTIIFSLTLLAQNQRPGPRPPEERAKQTVEYLASKMTLTKKKQDAMTPIFTEFYKKMSLARQNQDDKLRETAKKDLETSLSKILTDKEIKEVTRLLEEQRKQRFQERPPQQK